MGRGGEGMEEGKGMMGRGEGAVGKEQEKAMKECSEQTLAAGAGLEGRHS